VNLESATVVPDKQISKAEWHGIGSTGQSSRSTAVSLLDTRMHK